MFHGVLRARILLDICRKKKQNVLVTRYDRGRKVVREIQFPDSHGYCVSMTGRDGLEVLRVVDGDSNGMRV